MTDQPDLFSLEEQITELREQVERLTAMILAMQAERKPPPPLPLTDAISKTRL